MGPLRKKAMVANSDKHACVFCRIRNLVFWGYVSLKEKKKVVRAVTPFYVCTHDFHLRSLQSGSALPPWLIFLTEGQSKSMSEEAG